MAGIEGVTAMDRSEAGVIVRVVVADLLPDMAVIVVVPLATAVALPSCVMTALDVSEEVHNTPEDRS